MINFVSTFPPTICGIGSYTKALIEKMPRQAFRLIALEGEEFLSSISSCHESHFGPFKISLSEPRFPGLTGEIIWFQHAFGMWGRDLKTFSKLLDEAKRKNNKIIVTLHTIHFESKETSSGMQEIEETLLAQVLPLADAVTVFSDGAYWALRRTYPEHKDKLVVLRHGVQLSQLRSPLEAKERLFNYLARLPRFSTYQARQIDETYEHLLRKPSILLGNFGFITSDKDPIKLFEVSELVQSRLPKYFVCAMYVGQVQRRRDKRVEEYSRLLEELRAIQNGKTNFFFEEFLPDDIFPLAFRALDFSVFWCKNATQSGRLAHALGSGGCPVGRRIEGIGETLDLAGLPAAVSLEDLADKIVRLAGDQQKKDEAILSGCQYGRQLSFETQGQKHLSLAHAVRNEAKLPELDRTKPSLTLIIDNLYLSGRAGLDELPESIAAVLHVADDVNLHSCIERYHRMPIQDGIPIPPETLKMAILWIERNIASGGVLVFCRYGRGRSASIVVGYLCSKGLAFEQAVEFVRGKKPDISLLPELSKTISIALRDRCFRKYSRGRGATDRTWG